MSLVHHAALTTADVRDMRPGQYARSTHDISYRCSGCGGVEELDSHDYGISPNGFVVPAYTCPNVECQTTVVLVLDDWAPVQAEAQP